MSINKAVKKYAEICDDHYLKNDCCDGCQHNNSQGVECRLEKEIDENVQKEEEFWTKNKF